MSLVDNLRRYEGYRTTVYDDATGRAIHAGSVVVGNPTIGVGRNLTDARGLTQAEIGVLLDNDITIVFADLDRMTPWWRAIPQPAQDALAEMSFNLGWPRLKGFRKMLAALERGDYAAAADEALDSKWARDVGPARSAHIENLYRSAMP